MSNKKLTRFYVLSSSAYESLLKNSIPVNKLNGLDKEIMNVLKNEKLSTGEKWLLYSQQLSRIGEKFRKVKRNNIINVKDTEQKHNAPKKMVKTSEQTTQTESNVSDQATQMDLDNENEKEGFTDEDERYEDLFRKHRSRRIYSDEEDENNFSLDKELSLRKPVTPEIPRRSKRILMKQLPKEFDELTSEAAMLLAQEEIDDPDDRNYRQRQSLSPSRKIFEHKPTGSVITIGLDDVVEIVSSEDEEKITKETKKKKQKFFDTPGQKKKRKIQTGKGFLSVKWEKL